MVPEVIYIHGFASSSSAYKAIKLESFFNEMGYYNVLHPTIPVAPLKSVEFLQEILLYNPIKLVIGSSLGGFYALYLHKFFPEIPKILINPALKPSKDTEEFIGIVKRHNSDDFFQWTIKHVEQLKQLEAELNFNELDQSKLYFYLAKDDEVLDHNLIPKLFPKANIQFFDNAKHRFAPFDKILPEIFAIYQNAE